MNKTKIEWCRNPDGSQGYSWNPITGCLNGCDYCFARKLANGRLFKRYLDERGVLAPGYAEDISSQIDPFYPQFWPKVLEAGKRRYEYQDCRDYIKPRGIFSCDMSDLFGIGIPPEWTAKVLEVIRHNKADRFYLLTKQPQNLAKWSPFPPNCWVGVSVTNQEMANKSIPLLMNIEAKVRFVSLEPLLSPVDLNRLVIGQHYLEGAAKQEPYCVSAFESKYIFGDEGGDAELNKIDWVIVGAQTGAGSKNHQPKWEWIDEIEQAAGPTKTPIFEKNNLSDILKCPLRQEFPK